MTVPGFATVVRYGRGLTLGGVVLLCCWFINRQMEIANRHADAERESMREMFAQQSTQNNEMHQRQWQAQSRIADKLGEVAIALNRIEAILFIPPADRARAMPVEARKAAEAKIP